jgi:hypothetical protein
VLEIPAAKWTLTGPKQAASPVARVQALEQLLPSLIAILIVLSALALPVLLILWRLQRAYN